MWTILFLNIEWHIPNPVYLKSVSLNFKFTSQVKHRKEVEISNIDEKLQEEYEDRLKKALEELREVYDKQMQQNRDDFAKLYDDRVSWKI